MTGLSVFALTTRLALQSFSPAVLVSIYLRLPSRNDPDASLNPGGDDQEWTWQNGQVQLHNSAMCLTMPSGNAANGAKLQVAACSNSDSQQFQYTPWGQNQYVLGVDG